MDDRDTSDTERFASDHLPLVLHVANLLTGSRPQAEDVCIQAFRRVSRRPARSATRPDRRTEPDEARRLRRLYASVLRGWRRTGQRPGQRGRGPLELQDLRPESVTATATSPSVGSIIRDGLRALTDGERAALVLHTVAGLDVSDVSRIVRRPAAIVRRDLATSLEFLADATGTRPEQAEQRTRAALAPDHRAGTDAAQLLPRLLTTLSADATRSRRPRAALVAGAAVATAAVLVAAFLVGQSGEQDPVADGQSRDAPAIELPRTASGLKLVGFQRIMVTVPEGWDQDTPLCINVAGNAVHYPMDNELPPCVAAPAAGNSVGFGRYDTIDLPGDAKFNREHRVLLDEVLLLSDVIEGDSGFVQYAALKNANVAVAVRATKRSGLAMVLSSIQEVPVEYVVVPNVLKLDPEDAAEVLSGDALNGRVFADPSGAASGLAQRVVRQSPPVGTLLPFDATVNLGVVPN